ncbi:hypothetical protein PMAYCL1PPCAC_21972, partial [Pristionchus mayeri]
FLEAVFRQFDNADDYIHLDVHLFTVRVIEHSLQQLQKVLIRRHMLVLFDAFGCVVIIVRVNTHKIREAHANDNGMVPPHTLRLPPIVFFHAFHLSSSSSSFFFFLMPSLVLSNWIFALSCSP